MSNKKNWNRRQFLKALTATTTSAWTVAPGVALMDAIVQSVIGEAQALELDFESKNFVLVTNPGAPPRWMGDLFLSPFKGDILKNNKSVANVFSTSPDGSRYEDVDYHFKKMTVKGQEIFTPYIWGFDLPASEGSKRPMAGLLENMLHVRGINLLQNGHDLNRRKQTLPIGGHDSITARVAANSSKPVPGLNLSRASLPFVSKRGLEDRKLSYASSGRSENLLEEFIEPIKREGQEKLLAMKNQYSDAIERGLASIDQHIQSQRLGAKVLRANRSAAERLLRSNFDDAVDFWALNFEKYKTLIRRSFSTTDASTGAGLPLLTDKPVGEVGDRKQQDGSNNPIYNFNRQLIENPDLRTLLNEDTYIDGLAEGFTVAEYMIKKGLTASVNIDASVLRNLRATRNGKTQMTNLTLDQHQFGAMPVTLIMSHYFRAIYACLGEFVAELKKETDTKREGSLFDNTLIQVSGEFNRTPRRDGSGSDHGWHGQSVALFSGSIQKPTFLGNILRGSENSRNQGTWGQHAPVTELGESVRADHLADTIGTLLGVGPDSVNARSLVDSKGNPTVSESEEV